jgi:hypothetical protein
LTGSMGNFRYYLTPVGLLTDYSKSIWSSPWGLIETDGKTFDIIKFPIHCDSDKYAEQRVLLSIIRRMKGGK